jgi:hypothetical protein
MRMPGTSRDHCDRHIAQESGHVGAGGAIFLNSTGRSGRLTLMCALICALVRKPQVLV